MREIILQTYCSGRRRPRKILFSVLCHAGQDVRSFHGCPCGVCHVWKGFQALSSGRTQGQRGQAILFARLLVRLQCPRQPLSVDWRAARAHESRWTYLAQGSSGTRSVLLSSMPRTASSGSPPYPSLRDAQCCPLGRFQWSNSLPRVPRPTAKPRDGICEGVAGHRIHPFGGVACLV